ncbi:MAG: YchJ family protein [Deltaproteobacteria bacterium]|nr:YchJ family protein [Deltaproteobacteria bacterium]
MSKACPCQSGKNYEECCGPFIEKKEFPKTAEELMRSRYTAFTLADIDYINETRHPQSENDFDEKATLKWAKESKWLGFELVNKSNGGENDEGGKIEFIAKYTVDGKKQDHHEVALFQKYEGRWYFMDGDFVKNPTFVRETPKVGRNEPCPCGSGKKYKKCCGA